jgi:hypothetical protein
MSTNAPALSDVLHQQVSHKTGRRVRELAVEVRSNRVVLRGKASSFHVKQLAQVGVQEVLPDAQLENAIVVE